MEMAQEFKCILCGICCKIYVCFVTAADVRRILGENRGLKTGDFLKFYSENEVNIRHKNDARINKGWIQTNEGRFLMGLKNINEKCVFLDDTDMCRIYKFRPIVCRVYPFTFAREGEAAKVGYIEDTDCPSKETNPAPDTGGYLELLWRHYREYREYWSRIREWNESKRQDKITENFLKYITASQ